MVDPKENMKIKTETVIEKQYCENCGYIGDTEMVVAEYLDDIIKTGECTVCGYPITDFDLGLE